MATTQQIDNSLVGDRKEPYDAKYNVDKEQSHADLDASPRGNADAQPSPHDATTASKPSPFFSWANVVVAIPNLLIPTLYGYNIGVPGVYLTMYEYATNCELYKAQKPCETLSGAKCTWMAATDSQAGACGWAELTTCYRTYTSEAPCKADPVCAWSTKDNRCGNQVGYESIYQGLFAASMIIGAMAGSFAGGVLTKKLNYRLAFFVIGVISCIASVLTHVSTALFNYWLLFVARIILGVAMGWQTYAAPSYTSKFADKAHEKTLGMLFQACACLGTFLSAIIALPIGGTIGYSADRDANLKGRMHGFIAFSTLLSGLVLLLPLVTRDEVVQADDTDAVRVDSDGKADDDMRQQPSVRQMLLPLLVGVIMAASLEFTGILAIITYAPKIMRNLGINALLGNFITQTWSVVCVLCVIPLSKRFTLRTLFLLSTFGGSLTCLLLCGIPIYPGVSKTDSVKNGVAIAGIFLFQLIYLTGTGPCFFVLAIDVFPRSFQHIGSAVTAASNFIFFFVVVFCYPIATEGISGGPSGNPDKGQAVAFIFFGCVGIVTVAIEYFFMHPWSSNTQRARGSDSSSGN